MRKTHFTKMIIAVLLLALVLSMTACGQPAGNNTNTPSGNNNSGQNNVVPTNNSNNVEPGPDPGNNSNNVDPDEELTPAERAYRNLTQMCAALKTKGEGRIVLTKSYVSKVTYTGGNTTPDVEGRDVYETSFYTDASGNICFVRLVDRDGSGIYNGELQKDGIHYEYYLNQHEDGTREWVEGIASANAVSLPPIETLLIEPPEGSEIDTIIQEGNSYRLSFVKGFYRMLSEDSTVNPALYTIMDIGAVYSFSTDGTLTGCTWTYTEAWGDGTASYKNTITAEMKVDTTGELRATTWFRDNTNYVRPEYTDVTETAREYHANIPGKIIFDVRIPKLKDSLPGSDQINARISEVCEYELTMDEATLSAETYEYYSIRTADYEVCRFGNYYEIIITCTEGFAQGSGSQVQYYVFIYDAVGSREADAESFLKKMGYTQESFLEAAENYEDYELLTGNKLTDEYTYEELLERFYFDRDQNLIFVTDLSF